MLYINIAYLCFSLCLSVCIYFFALSPFLFLNGTMPIKCNTVKPWLAWVQSSNFMTLNILQMYIVEYVNCIIVVLISTLISMIIILT